MQTPPPPNIWVFSHMTTNHVTLTCLLFWTQDAVESNGPVSRPTGLVPLQLTMFADKLVSCKLQTTVSVSLAPKPRFSLRHTLCDYFHMEKAGNSQQLLANKVGENRHFSVATCVCQTVTNQSLGLCN